MKATKIRISSGVSIEKDGTWYKFEYQQECDLEPNDNLKQCTEDLWDYCHSQVDTQVEAILVPQNSK